MLLKEKKEIEDWLKKYDIKFYELIENKEYGYVVNVNNDVYLDNKNLKNIKVRFNEINGWFSCNYNQLKSLEGCPKIINGLFNCSNNQLNSLEFCPEIIKESFWCHSNNLNIEGLKCLPKEIGFDCIEIDENHELGDLQFIDQFTILKEKVKEILKTKEEKENLLKIINKNTLNIKNNIYKI